MVLRMWMTTKSLSPVVVGGLEQNYEDFLAGLDDVDENRSSVRICSIPLVFMK